MPQAFSVSTLVSVVPAAPAVPSAPAATAAGGPVGAARPNDNAAPADFLGQLKTALKNLTKAVTQPNLAPEATTQIAPAQAPATDAPAAHADLKDAPPVDHSADALPDVLAALGFVPVPIAFAPLPTVPSSPAPPDTGKLPAAAAPVPAVLPRSAQPEAPQPTPAVPQAVAQPPAQVELAGLPLPEAQLPMPEAVSQAVAAAQTPPTKTSVAAPKTDAPAPPDPTIPTVPTTTTDLTPLTPAPAIAVPQGQPALHPAAATGSTFVPPQAIAPAQHGAHQNASQQGSAEDRQQPSSPKAKRIGDGPSGPPTPAPIDSALAAAARSTASSSPIVLSPQVRPAEVVSQIAHQADLYRLPGNRGVRIQLHPEDLGGVEVSLRYGVGGALQLHINVEHAATGSLVQAGWTELRDALATQGISPDRMVMSVTAPNASSQLDFSSGGNGRQTDPGTAGFAQSQSGQQRQDTPEQTGQRGWNGAVEPISSADDSPRVASTTAATSRIDYRA